MSFQIHNDAINRIFQLSTSVANLDNSVQFLLINHATMVTKGVNIDDTTAPLTPISHNPTDSRDTFPHSWNGTNSQIGAIRTYHYNTGVVAKQWVAWAVQNNIKVIVGLTLGLDSAAAEIAAFEADYAAANATLKAQYDANVIAIAVGNEQTDVAAMNAGMISVKAKVGVTLPSGALVTTVLAISPTWIINTFPPQNATFTMGAAGFMSLVPNLEIVCFNCYGGYFSLGNIPGLTPQQALTTSLSWTSDPPQSEFSVLLNQFGAIRYAMATAVIGVPFWCTETGWSSTPIGAETLPGWSSISHLKTFYQNFLGFNTTTMFTPQSSSPAVLPPERIFFYAVRDVPTRPEYFGLFTSQSTPLDPKV